MRSSQGGDRLSRGDRHDGRSSGAGRHNRMDTGSSRHSSHRERDRSSGGNSGSGQKRPREPVASMHNNNNLYSDPMQVDQGQNAGVDASASASVRSSASASVNASTSASANLTKLGTVVLSLDNINIRARASVASKKDEKKLMANAGFIPQVDEDGTVTGTCNFISRLALTDIEPYKRGRKVQAFLVFKPDGDANHNGYTQICKLLNESKKACVVERGKDVMHLVPPGNNEVYNYITGKKPELKDENKRYLLGWYVQRK